MNCVASIVRSSFGTFFDLLPSQIQSTAVITAIAGIAIALSAAYFVKALQNRTANSQIEPKGLANRQIEPNSASSSTIECDSKSSNQTEISDPYIRLPFTRMKESLNKVCFTSIKQYGSLHGAFEKLNARKILGIKLIENFNSTDPDLPTHCDFYVFKDEPWYQKKRAGDGFRHFCTNVLFAPTALTFLRSEGYQRVDLPKKGDIIIYFTKKSPRYFEMSIPAHFGIVDAISNKGRPIVRSKFADGPVYQHCLEMIPSAFGDEYVLLRKQQSSASNDSSDV